MEKYLVKFLVWRIKHLSDKNFVLILSGLIGIVVGSAAVGLKTTVHLIQHKLTSGFTIGYANYLYFGYPLVGILITVVMARMLREKLGHGITNILYAISKKSSMISPSKMFSRMLTSTATVSLGGSVGLEAPAVVTGAAIGANIGKVTHLGQKKRTILISCGSAAAISAIFNSPVAGVIFCLEVILAEVTIATFIPLLIASVFASLVSLTLLGDDVLFSFKLRDSFQAIDTPFYIILGMLCGLVSVYFARVTHKVESLLVRIKQRLPRALVGGVILGLIIFVFPPIYGEGYYTIKLLLAGEGNKILNNSLFFSNIHDLGFLLLFLTGVILVKPIASALTIGAGGNGGIFAPSLFLGGLTGYTFASLTDSFVANAMSPSNFTLVGMCGVMSGVLHAPLTAIFLIAEITGGYELFIPLMLVSAIALSTSSFFEKYSLYTKHLIESGDLIQYDKDKQVLSLIDLKKVVEKDLLTIHPNASLEDMVDLVRASKRNIFPVVNEKEELLGIVTLDDIRNIMFDEEDRPTIPISSLMHSPPAHVTSHENMQSVMRKFEVTGAWNLPVIDDGKYVGFLSKSRIFNTYRTKLIRQNKE